MRRIHATSTSFRTYVLIFSLIILSILFVRAVPALIEVVDISFFRNNVANMGILYAIIVGFLMSLTLSRRRALEEYISQELNKVRRVFHLAKHIAKANPKHDAWFRGVQASLSEYTGFFCTHDFSRYEEANPLFRKVTYAVYELPSQDVSYNQNLYASLLDTTAEATEAREFIRSKMSPTIGNFQWIVLIVVTLTLSVILVSSTPVDFISRSFTTAVIFNLFLVLLLLYEYDVPNRKLSQGYAQNFAHNMEEIDMCLPEKKGKKVAKRVTKRKKAR